MFGCDCDVLSDGIFGKEIFDKIYLNLFPAREFHGAKDILNLEFSLFVRGNHNKRSEILPEQGFDIFLDIGFTGFDLNGGRDLISSFQVNDNKVDVVFFLEGEAFLFEVLFDFFKPIVMLDTATGLRRYLNFFYS